MFSGTFRRINNGKGNLPLESRENVEPVRPPSLHRQQSDNVQQKTEKRRDKNVASGAKTTRDAHSVNKKLKSEIKHVKSKIKELDSTVSELAQMLRILNRKLDMQNLDMRKIVDSLEQKQQQNKRSSQQEYDRQKKQIEAVENRLLKTSTVKNRLSKSPMVENQLSKSTKQNEQQVQRPFKQQYDTITRRKIYTGDWDCDELLCYTDDDDVIEDNPVGWNTSDRAYKTLPPGLRLAKSTIPNAGTGVFSDVFIPKGTYFGPYDGDVVYRSFQQYNKGEYVFTIYKLGKRLFGRDAGPIEMSNWTRFLNCPRDFLELNVEPMQCREHVYFRTIRDVKPGRELLFFYGRNYAKYKLGIREEAFCKGYNASQEDPIISEYISEHIC
ncbi:unnamed protein product [Owenia fusiformis]|uniref:Uncharacterized protein n=1 Tax=Owenia fusiformis TaxID=6347 RepID=A0A8J1UQJ4_OWEFU|nr:unnamed protein product [Owenia fusiformis]